MNNKIIKFSYSKIDTFKKCERKYDYIYNKHFPREKGNYHSFRGSLLHDLIEHDIQGLPFEPQFDKENEEIFSYENFNEVLKEYKQIAKSDIVLKLKKIYKEFSNSFKIENKLEFPKESFNFMGFVDTMIINNNKMIIIDYKTGEVFEDYTQLKYYAVIASKIYTNIEEFLLTLSFISKNEEKIEIIKKEDLENIEKELIKKINKILKTKLFRKNISPLCKHCMYEEACLYHSQLDIIDKEITEVRDYLPSGISNKFFYDGYFDAKYLILSFKPTVYDLENNQLISILKENEENNFWKKVKELKLNRNNFFISTFNYYTYKDGKTLEDIYLKIFNKINKKFINNIKQKNIIINSKEAFNIFQELLNIKKHYVFKHNEIYYIKDFKIFCIDFEKKDMFILEKLDF